MKNQLEDISVVPSFGFGYIFFCQFLHTNQDGFECRATNPSPRSHDVLATYL